MEMVCFLPSVFMKIGIENRDLRSAVPQYMEQYPMITNGLNFIPSEIGCDDSNS